MNSSNICSIDQGVDMSEGLKRIKETNFSLFYYYCFLNVRLVQANMSTINCSWIISVL